MLSGVCGGLAIYFNVNPTLIRLLWVLLFFMNPLMIVVYLIGAVIIPVRPVEVFYDFSEEPEKIKHESESESKPEE